jgi:predicted nucleic acid-binding protein
VKVLVDTSIWSLALRRKAGALSAHEERLARQLAGLVEDDLVAMIGPIRQEILSGVRSSDAFETLKRRLRHFDDEVLVADDYEAAAQAGKACRAKGISGSPVDFLICAVTVRRGLAIFTADSDFSRYKTVLPLMLYAA